MRLHLLGTGASDGWPNPWCACASCRAAAAAGVVRGQTSALVDGRLLLDVGAEAPRAAVRQGTSLAGVEAVLVTHAHPDHHAWPAWMWRGWAAGTAGLELVAPPAVLGAARPRLDAHVMTVPARAGDVLRVGALGAPYEVRVLAARHAAPEVGPAVLYDVTGPDGVRLLWACDTGVLPDATLELVTGRAYDAVVLELTSAHLPDHHDLRTWPEQVAELRRRGAVTDRTHVLAAHLGHDNPPPRELDRVLAGWGARAPRDGEVVLLGAEPPPVRPARRTLVMGAARSGKSAHAEQLVAAEPHVRYVATAPDRPDDAEWQQRIAAHRARRPENWQVLEPVRCWEVAAAVRSAGPCAVLVDDVGLWVTRVLDETAAWQGPVPAEPFDDLVAAWRDCRGPAVLVAPQVGAGVVPAHPSGRRFRDVLGALTARLAEQSDDVVEIVAGLPRSLR